MRVSRNWMIFISIIAALVTAVGAQEHTGGIIKGLVIDESTKYPLQFVNVALRKSSDSTIVTGQVTDSTGKVTITGVPAGEYYITAQIIGYEQKKTPLFHIDPDHLSFNFGKIRLGVANILMDEVQVSTEKPLYTASIDRKVYNVDQDLMSKAGSASELLQNVPSVQVDIDGNVSLRGSSNVLFMLNGRPSPLLNKNSATVLDQLPANTIERIEVITNPTAEFKPDAAAGIINIVLKKNRTPGTSGSLTGNAGNKERYNSSVNLNYNPGRFNMFASYGIRRNDRDRNSSDDRQQADTSITFYNQTVASHARPLSHTASFGCDYRLSKQNQLGISGSYFYNSVIRRETSDNYLYNNNRVLTSSYLRNRSQDEHSKEPEFTAFYQHDFSKEDHTLRFEFTSAQAPEVEDNRFTNIYRVPVAPNAFDKSLLKTGENSNQLTVEYSNPLSEESALKAGYEAEFNGSDFDFQVDYFDTSQQQYVTDPAKTNRFRNDEAIHALFGTYKQSFGRFGLMAGLRGEYSAVKSNLLTLDSTITNSYFNVYPSLHLSYELGKLTELQLSYSKRTRRPELDDLNPFPEYIDPRNIRSGNPRLLPEYIHSLELGCQYRQGEVTLVPALFYRYTYNRFTWVARALNDTVLLTTHENLSYDQAGGLEVTLSATAQKLLSVHGTASVFQNQIDASNLSNGKKTITTWSSNATMDVNLSETSRLQLNSNYRSSQLIAQGKNSPSYTLNAGFRQEIYGGKLLLLATITDIFHTMKREYTVDTPTLHQTTITRMDSRVMYLGLTYHFGTPSKKSRDEQIHYDETP